MRIATAPAVGPIIAVNGLNDACGIHIPYMAWLIKIEIYPL